MGNVTMGHPILIPAEPLIVTIERLHCAGWRAWADAGLGVDTGRQGRGLLGALWRQPFIC